MRERVTASEPPVLEAVTVYEDVGVGVVGVPVIAPVELSRLSPEGSDGDTLQVALSPEFVGVMVEMALFATTT